MLEFPRCLINMHYKNYKTAGIRQRQKYSQASSTRRGQTEIGNTYWPSNLNIGYASFWANPFLTHAFFQPKKGGRHPYINLLDFCPLRGRICKWGKFDVDDDNDDDANRLVSWGEFGQLLIVHKISVVLPTYQDFLVKKHCL